MCKHHNLNTDKTFNFLELNLTLKIKHRTDQDVCFLDIANRILFDK